MLQDVVVQLDVMDRTLVPMEVDQETLQRTREISAHTDKCANGIVYKHLIILDCEYRYYM